MKTRKMNKFTYLSLVGFLMVSCYSGENTANYSCFQEQDHYTEEPITDNSPIIQDVDEEIEVASSPAPGIKYPRLARTSGVKGKVIAEVTVSKTGKLQKIEIIRGLGYCLDEAVVEFLRESTYKAAKKDGLAVRSTKEMPFNFSIHDN